MDFKSSSRRSSKKTKKNGRAKRNLAGRPRGNILQSPLEHGDQFGSFLSSDDDSPSRSLSGTTPRSAKRHRNPNNREEDDGGSESSGSRFSTGRSAEEAAAARGRREETTKSRRRNQSEAERRQHTKDELAKTQRSSEEPINVDDCQGFPTFNPPSFDGVRIDRVTYPANEEYVNRVHRELGGNNEEDRAERGENTSFRGRRHEKSVMAQSLTPKIKRGQRIRIPHCERSSRIQSTSGRQGRSSSHSTDPLDTAQAMQESNRGTSGRSSYGRKNSDFTKAMGNLSTKLDQAQGVANRGASRGNSGQGTKSHPQYGKADMSSNRDKRRIKIKMHVKETLEKMERKRPDTVEQPERRSPLSGEKRKNFGGHWPNKNQSSPKGCRDNAIDVDESTTTENVENDVQSVDSSASPKNEEVDIVAAIQGCETPLNHDDHDAALESQRASFLGDGRAKHVMNGMANLGMRKDPGAKISGRKKPARKKVNDMNAHLQRTRKNDTVEDDASFSSNNGGLRNGDKNSPTNNVFNSIPRKSFNSNDGLRNVDSNSPTNHVSNSIRMKPEVLKTKKSSRSRRSISRMCVEDKEPKDDSWLSTQKPANAANNGRRKSNRLNNSMAEKFKKQGGRFEPGTPSSSSPHGRKNKEFRKKNQRQSTIPVIRSTGSLRRTRSRSKSGEINNDGNDGIITIIDSSSDEEEDEVSIDVPDKPVEESVAEGRGRRKRAAGDRASIDAVRIAIGKKVFHRKCELSFQFGTASPYILFTYLDGEGKRKEHSVYLNDDDLKDVKYYIASEDENEDTDESMTMIAFRITPNGKNNFIQYRKSYNQEDTEGVEKNEKQYISVEVRDTSEFQAMLLQMRQHPSLDIWCSEASKIPPNDLAKYTQALQEESKKELQKRLGSATRTRSGGNKKKKDNDNELLLVYPFGVDEALLTKASSKLRELGGDRLGVEHLEEGMQPSVEGDSGNGPGKSSSLRTHYVTIHQDDKDRLQPGQFLNDSLVDFWMRWISRDAGQASNVHFFTSHFMTTLKNDGPEAVSSWTAKKNIDVFEKKFIFVPVNADLHWSLCVVVNPGHIDNNHNETAASEIEEHACILFLDSLKMHSKNAYAKHIRKWLNFEWKRLGKRRDFGGDGPFRHEQYMPLRSPKIPYQENGCDCGVFVCRYAYNLFQMRHLSFTYHDIYKKKPLIDRITLCPAFEFDMADIARIREEIGILIDNLSKLYLKLKEQEKANTKSKRREQESLESESRKGDLCSETAISAPDEDVKRGEGSMVRPALDNDGDRIATTPCPEEKEHHSQQEAELQDNSGHEIAVQDTGEAVFAKAGNGNAILSSSEEKENISRQEVGSQENSMSEIASPDKLASTQLGNTTNDIVETGGMVQSWALDL